MLYKIALIVFSFLLFIGMANASSVKNVSPVAKTHTGVANSVAAQTSSGSVITLSLIQDSLEKIWIQISHK